jgi:hypothetical protein
LDAVKSWFCSVQYAEEIETVLLIYQLVFASGSTVMNSDNTRWPEEILDLKEAMIFIITTHTEAATDMKVS